MSFVINTNVMSLVAQQNLNRSQNMLNQAITRLSSGKKINSAADDAAGMAIANRMSAQITGLTQARSNANDGISLAQTTEGALNQINDNLQRIRELSVQAANGTLSDSDLASVQDEINARLEEIDRVSGQTSFNGVNVLAQDNQLSIQVGDDDDETISIQLNKITTQTLGLTTLDMTNQITSDDLTALGQDGTVIGSDSSISVNTFDFHAEQSLHSEYDLVVGSGAALYVQDSEGAYHNVSFSSTTGMMTISTSVVADVGTVQNSATTFVSSTSGNLTQLSTVENATWKTSVGTISDFTVYQQADGDLIVHSSTTQMTYQLGSNGNTINWETGDITLSDGVREENFSSVGFTTISSSTLLTSPGAIETTLEMSSINTNLGGTNVLMRTDDGNYLLQHTDDDGVTYYDANLETSTAGGVGTVSITHEIVVNPLDALDEALAQVDALRSGLGAMQNRFDSAITNLATTTTNLKAARSRIVDANYAHVVSQLSKAQILQQAGTSVLAQANSSQQSVLSLLR